MAPVSGGLSRPISTAPISRFSASLAQGMSLFTLLTSLRNGGNGERRTFFRNLSTRSRPRSAGLLRSASRTTESRGGDSGSAGMVR